MSATKPLNPGLTAIRQVQPAGMAMGREGEDGCVTHAMEVIGRVAREVEHEHLVTTADNNAALFVRSFQVFPGLSRSFQVFPDGHNPGFTAI